MASGYEKIIQALEAHGCRGHGAYWECPAHVDHNPSLSVHEGEDGRALVYDHGGCDISAISSALGLKPEDYLSDDVGVAGTEASAPLTSKVVARYVYTDEQGNPLIRVYRTEPKGFFQESRFEDETWQPRVHPDIPRPLYNLPSVITAVASGQTVWVVEGEKDADALIALGVCATTNIGGAGKWRDEYSEILRGAEVIVIADQDEVGGKHANQVASSLTSIAASVQVLAPLVGKDVSDHLEAGYGIEDLIPQASDSEGFWFDWETDPEPVSWLLEPVLPERAFVLVYGPTEASKSMVLQGIGAELSRQGRRVTFYSLENPSAVDGERLRRFKPDRRNFRISHHMMNLDDGEQVDRLIERDKGQDLVILDTLSHAFQPKSEDENARFIAFANVIRQVIKETGATVVVVDHTGYSHDQERGASAKRQQVDMSILMQPRNVWLGKGHPSEFSMKNMKKARYSNPFHYDGAIRDSLNGDLVVDIPRLKWYPDAVDAVDKADQGLGDPTVATDADESKRTASIPMTLDEKLAFARVQAMIRKLEEDGQAPAQNQT